METIAVADCPATTAAIDTMAVANELSTTAAMETIADTNYPDTSVAMETIADANYPDTSVAMETIADANYSDTSVAMEPVTLADYQDTSVSMETIAVANYPASLLNQLSQLQTDKALCDVYLKAGDGQLSAHRLVLMAASPYFETRLSRELSNSPEELSFEGVPINIVEAVVGFMYSGELTISKEDLQAALTFCEELMITSVVDAYQKKNLSEAKSEPTVMIEKDGEPVFDNTGSDEKGTQTEGDKPKRKYVRKTDKPKLAVKLKDVTPTKKDQKKAKTNTRKQLKPAKTKKSKLADSDDEYSPRKKRTSKTKAMVKIKIEPEDDYTENNFANEDFMMNPEEIKVETNPDYADDTDDETYTPFEDKPIKPKAKRGRKRKADKLPEDLEKCIKQAIDDIELEEPVKKKKRGPKKKEVSSTDIKKKRVWKKRTKRWPCGLCNRNLTSMKRKVFHQYVKHDIEYDTKRWPMVPCKEEGCTYVATNRHNLSTHMQSRHAEDRPHICEFCGKSFKLATVLACHINIHTLKKKYQCPQCDESFNQHSGLGVHIKRYHMGESTWGELCHLCSEKFIQKQELAWHLFRQHDQPLPEKYRKHICDICNYQTKSSADLVRHKNAHEGIKPHVCGICSKGCATKSELKRHVSFHGEKTFKCDFSGCSFACTDYIGLDKHIKLMHTHKNFKPYLCSVCPYRTGVRGNLDKHIRQVHNLIVITKHTVPLKIKYPNFNSGDIITKDGKLIATAKERKALQDRYRAENPDGIDRGFEYIVAGKPSTKRSRRKSSDDDDDDGDMLDLSTSERNMEGGYIPPVVDISPLQSSHSAMNSSMNNLNSSLTEMTPLSNYVYMEGSPPIRGAHGTVQDLRTSLANQASAAASNMFRSPSNGLFMEQKYQH